MSPDPPKRVSIMAEPASLIVEGGCVVTGDARDTRFDRADVVVAGDRIVAIGLDAARRHLAASPDARRIDARSEEHTSELQSLMRISYAVFCLKKKKQINIK